ncbi:hypothetical protein DV737_g2441, partial [Chaetothyriales sp. CBS 132003]
MATNVHTIVAEAQDVISTDLSASKAPPVPSAPIKDAATPGPAAKKRSVRSKYRHVFAFHAKSRPSCLSHESPEAPSFLGFRNLMVLTVVVMNLRLVIENAKKYGILITLKMNVRASDVNAALLLLALTPCHLFVAYIIEKVAMAQAKGVVGRRKKTDTSMTAPEGEKERKDFYHTWWWIAIAHTLNATMALLITSVVVFYHIRNPGIGAFCELHAIVVWLKTCSYAFTNRDLRHAMLYPAGPESALPEIYSNCPYPQNIALSNLCYFWAAPTLVYQPYYPRTERIRWPFFWKRVGETVALSVFIWLACAQYAEPVLRNSLDKMQSFDLPSITERLLKLSTISLIVWLAGFFAFFQSFLNALAEITRFGDREFYQDWWNSTCLRTYWSTWNKPVYHFMRRHVYEPLRGRGWSHGAASTFVFIFSAILHEVAIGVPTHNFLGVAFLGMVAQMPLILATEPLARGDDMGKKVLGNCLFWINFVFFGQPLSAMIYYFAWQKKYGQLSKSNWISNRRPAYKGTAQYEQERGSLSYVIDVLPPAARRDNAAESIPVRHLHTSLGKSKKPVTIVRWMPEGRRLLAGVHNGEFMLWNGMSFNFETVTAMGSSSLRTAEWSNKKDWLVAANDEGTVYYLQPTLNNPYQFKGHDAPIRDLAFAPTDSKFVTASDDNSLKIWDFTSSQNISTFSDHGWDVKACDWHPSKGLVVSGSKDHSVRLWDPRTSRNLTTLHGHKAPITATVFSRLRDQLLATAARDGQTRIFDLRLMRDVAILRGHEKGVASIAWHPLHASIISSGGDDGALHTYLLSEPNTPAGISTATVSPYATAEPKSAPVQSIYPAHRITHAHDSAIWSLDWHPVGHILATGSNDHYIRFWSRALPGDTKCFRDQFHLGEEGAEAQGTWDRKFGHRQRREAEEQEEEDEREGLEDQAVQGPANALPGIPGLAAVGGGLGGGGAVAAMPGLGNLPVPGPGARPIGGIQQSSGFDNSAVSGAALAAQFTLPHGIPPPPPPGMAGLGVGGSSIPGLRTSSNGSGAGGPPQPLLDSRGSVRSRAPLPSQKEGFRAEQARGNYRVAK